MSVPTQQSPSSVSSGLVIGGYVSAVLIPFIGLICGIVAIKRYAGVGSNHGPWIVMVSALSFALNLLLIVGSSA